MPISVDEKEAALIALMDRRRLGQIAELSLRAQNHASEADEIWRSVTRLSAEIDILIGKMMDDWDSKIDSVTKRLVKANGKLQLAVDEIKRDIKIAQNVVKVIGLLDDAIGIAQKLVKLV